MRISDWSSDVCSSDLTIGRTHYLDGGEEERRLAFASHAAVGLVRHHALREQAGKGLLDVDHPHLVQRARPEARVEQVEDRMLDAADILIDGQPAANHLRIERLVRRRRREAQKIRSEEHTSELQSLMRNSYAVLCLKKK